MVFRSKNLDYELSPYTGLTREGWVEAGEYLLKGIFDNINQFDDPVVMPRQETEITYPHLRAPQDIQEAQRRAEMFEGLTRSFFIAAPLISDNPKLYVSGYPIAEYYKQQILRSCTEGDPICVGSYNKLQEITGWSDPFRAFQQTVETCALVIGLWTSKEQIWDTYTKEQKDVIAAFVSGFAHANTVPQNWRLFNMLDLAFLHMEGYHIDKEIMLDHAQEILNYYVGDGWYRDGHSFDYYSCWAFNVYAPLWNVWYGYENEPQIARKFEENSNRLMNTYGDFFDCDGFTNMWGRSNIYRNAATSAFEANFFLKNSTMDPGLARRISSGSLMQFLSREDFLYKGVPALGFYGQFAPLIQGYSCAESPFWLGKVFLCLHLPKNHPFWTEKENNGTWENLKDEINSTTLNGPALCFTNHGANKSTVLRTGKVVKDRGDIHGMWNYSKLSFSTKYPWEAAPVLDRDGQPVSNREIESQQYVLKDVTTGELQRCNVTLWNGEKNGILYRRQFFEYDLKRESMWIQAINLADFPVKLGIMRVDKLRLFRRPVMLTLGSYGFPDNGTEIIEKIDGKFKALILKGTDFTGKKKQICMTIYDGWSKLDYVRSKGTNPDSEKSIILYASTERKKQYGSYEPYVLISQVITKENHDEFNKDDIFPIASIQYDDSMKSGGYGDVIIEMKNGDIKRVNFEGIEANLSL